MDLKYTEEQEGIRELARQFAQNELAPEADKRDKTGEFNYELWKRMGDLGLIGMMWPEEYGGNNADFLSFNLAMEEISRVDSSIGVTLQVASVSAHQLVMESDEQKNWKELYILPVARGEATGASSVTEPQAGSNTAGIQTHAVLEGDEFVINGAKSLCTNPGLKINRFVNVLAIVETEGEKEFDSILVPTGAPGYTIGHKYEKMGWKSSDTRELYFDNCRVPASNLLKASSREEIVRHFYPMGRVELASNSLGIAEACFDLSLSYAQQRIAFKRPISKFQFVQDMLVEMALEKELSRLIRDKAALALGQHDFYKLSSMAKIFCCESAKKAADLAIQIHGGVGYTEEYPLSRFYRDNRVISFGDVTTQIQKWIIARELGC